MSNKYLITVFNNVAFDFGGSNRVHSIFIVESDKDFNDMVVPLYDFLMDKLFTYPILFNILIVFPSGTYTLLKNPTSISSVDPNVIKLSLSYLPLIR